MSYKINKGFTLVELLAVIAVLAIIVATTYPVVGALIKHSRQRSYESQTKMIEENAVSYVSQDESGKYENLDTIFIPLSELQTAGAVTKDKIIDPKTEKVMNGCITITKDSYGQYKAKYGSEPCVIIKNLYETGEEVYYNPVTNMRCTSSEVNKQPLAKTGCLKWNVITVGDTTSRATIDIMLDHNTTQNVTWNNYMTNSLPIEAIEAVKSDTAGWNSSIKNSARLIKGYEIAEIDGNTSWTAASSYYTIKKSPWLYQNLGSAGTESAPYGYWTDTAYTTDPNYAWHIYYNGNFTFERVYYNDHGVRPVITVFKKNL